MRMVPMIVTVAGVFTKTMIVLNMIVLHMIVLMVPGVRVLMIVLVRVRSCRP
jgi:hypothetical protein